MLTINTNLSSLIAQGSMKSSTNKLNQAIERMTTGFKINHAKDNAANYSIATNMTTKIGAYNVAEDNAAMGLDLISTAEGTLSQIEDKLQRLRALAEQASNGTYGEQSLNAINAEANALVDEINRLYSTAEYNSIKLFDQETQIPDDPNIPKAQYDGFIKEVVKRDTSTMTTLASVDESADLADGTYSISTPEEMKKLADMTNAGLVSAGDEFVLANDIDLSQYENWTPIGNVNKRFYGKFDGNGYAVKKLKIGKNSEMSALFGFCSNSIKNLALVDVEINSNQQAAGISGQIVGIVDNCYVTGSIISTTSASGICVNALGAVNNCYTDVNLTARSCSGILLHCAGNVSIANCFTKSVNNSLVRSAGILVNIAVGANVTLDNCHVLSDTELTGVFVSVDPTRAATIDINNCGYNSSYDKKQTPLFSETLATMNINNVVSFDLNNNEVAFMIGINSDSNSQLKTNLALDLKKYNILRFMGNIEFDYLASIDSILSSVSEKQTHFGAISNRLESVLEEITIQRDNLVSSRSTIRDADIAEVSSHYIQQQILQQASATLLATANQSPSIALQLI